MQNQSGPKENYSLAEDRISVVVNALRTKFGAEAEDVARRQIYEATDDAARKEWEATLAALSVQHKPRPLVRHE